MKKQFLSVLRNKKSATSQGQLLQPIGLYIGLTVSVLALLGYKLLSLVPFGPREVPEFTGSASLSQIKQDVIFAPSKVLEFIILKLSDNDTLIRGGSVVIAAIAIILLFAMLKKWFTTRVSLLTIALFATSSWTLHVGRMAGHEALYLWVMPILLLSCLWFLSKKHDKKLPIAAALLTATLYIPGSVLLIVAGALAFRKYILRNVKEISLKIKLMCAAIVAIGVTPLIYSFIGNKSQIFMWLGYDRNQEISLGNIAHNFANIADTLFWRGSADAGMWLRDTPVLDIFSVAMLVLGVYAYRAGYYPAREKLVFGLGILGILIIGLGNVVTIGLLLPLVYIFIANGLAYMLQSWFTVFPKNPVARPLGIVLLTLVVALSCAYNLQRYFTAWPNADATQSALQQRL